jgi:drug/metabolite transporter (DMT)-like permease
MSNQTKGIFFAVVTAVISGVSIFVNKYAVIAIKQPLVFATVKNIGVAVLLFVLLLSTKKLANFRALSRRDWLLLVLVGIVGGSVPFYLFFTGLMTIPAINGALLHKTLVFWVALMAFPLLKERLSKKQMIGVALLFGANLLVGGFKGFKLSSGEFMVLMATLMWSVENIIAKKVLPHINANIVSMARMGFGAVILLIISVITQPAQLRGMANLSSTQWLWVGLTVILLFGYVTTWYRALSFAPATTVSAVLVTSTLVTNVLSAVFATHTWSLTLSLQSALMLVGFALLAGQLFAKRHQSLEAA